MINAEAALRMTHYEPPPEPKRETVQRRPGGLSRIRSNWWVDGRMYHSGLDCPYSERCFEDCPFWDPVTGTGDCRYNES